MNINKIVTILFLIFTLNISFANGGSIDDECCIGSTGNITPKNEVDIQVLKQDLDVKIDGEEAKVRVKYVFYNEGNTENVLYGFPIDINNESEGASEKAGKAADKKYVYNYKVKVNNREKTYKTILQDENEDTWSEEHALETDYGVRRWFISKIKFPAKKRCTVTVSYTVKLGFCDAYTSKDFYPSFSDRVFSYSLLPASFWGDGKVGKLRISIDIREALKKGYILNEPDEFPIEAEFEDGVLEYFQRDADYAEIDHLNIRVNNASYRMSKIIMNDRLTMKDFESVKASSTLSSQGKNSYNVRNLFDGNFKTAWVEGVKGVGEEEWIEIKFPKPKKIYFIGILNGYLKDKNSYKRNGKITSGKIELWGDENDDDDDEYIERTFELPERKYKEFSINSFYSFIDVLEQFGEISETVTRIRITIDEADAGTRWEDTCISEIFIY